MPPNTQWKYSNLGYQLLGELVARVSGMTYARYIRSRILTPLKMTSTVLDPLPQRLRARRAIGYEPRFLSDELDPAPPEPGVFQAEGGLWSCVDDLARWLSCQFDPEPVLSEPDGRRDAQAPLSRRPRVDARLGDRLVRATPG